MAGLHAHRLTSVLLRAVHWNWACLGGPGLTRTGHAATVVFPIFRKASAPSRGGVSAGGWFVPCRPWPTRIRRLRGPLLWVLGVEVVPPFRVCGTSMSLGLVPLPCALAIGPAKWENWSMARAQLDRPAKGWLFLTVGLGVSRRKGARREIRHARSPFETMPRRIVDERSPVGGPSAGSGATGPFDQRPWPVLVLVLVLELVLVLGAGVASNWWGLRVGDVRGAAVGQASSSM